MRVNKRARQNVLSVHVPLCWSINESLTNKVVRNWFTECRLASVDLFRYYLNNYQRYIFTDSLKNNLNFRVIRIVELSVTRNVVRAFEYWLFLRNIDRSREFPFCFSDDRWRLIFELFFEKKNKSLRVTSYFKFGSRLFLLNIDIHEYSLVSCALYIRGHFEIIFKKENRRLRVLSCFEINLNFGILIVSTKCSLTTCIFLLGNGTIIGNIFELFPKEGTSEYKTNNSLEVWFKPLEWLRSNYSLKRPELIGKAPSRSEVRRNISSIWDRKEILVYSIKDK